jgi:hypothetical protein
VSEPALGRESGWPSKNLRLTLLISFGGLLALMVIAGLKALRLARQLRAQEERFCSRITCGSCSAAVRKIPMTW